MRHIGLFEGIGGFSLAAKWMGWETVAWCEINPFCQKVLGFHFPKAKQHYDVKTTDFSIYRGQCEIITGGFPCQPYSVAGERKGKEDERHLWPEMLRAIREVQPGWVVGENVLGLLNWSGGLVFDEVQADLEAEGYEVWPYVLPACGKNAPHRRDRIWFVAYADRDRNRDHAKPDREADSLPEKHRATVCAGQPAGAGAGDATYTTGDRKHRAPELEDDKGQGGERRGRDADNAGEIPGENRDRDATDADASGRGQGEQIHERGQAEHPNSACVRQADTDATGDRLQGRGDAGELRGEGTRGDERPENVGIFSGTDWQDFPTEPAICFGDDGVSAGLDTTAISYSKWRVESVQAGGNAVVPEVVLEIYLAIEKFEKNKTN